MTDDADGKGGRHDGPASTSPYPVSRLSAPYDLVSAAAEIQAADRMLGSVVGGRLDEIARQIRQLQAQAAAALEEARLAAELHRVRCSFRKRPGEVYHLYRRPSGERYFSMLSPEDWGTRLLHSHEGSYRLEADMGWTRASEIAERDLERRHARRLLGDGSP